MTVPVSAQFSTTSCTLGPPDLACNSRIISAILSYRVDALWEVQRWEQNYAKLSARHKV